MCIIYVILALGSLRITQVDLPEVSFKSSALNIVPAQADGGAA